MDITLAVEICISISRMYHPTVMWSNYSRDLDLNTAIAGVNYDKGNTHYSGRNFHKLSDNVIVTHITADGSEKISLDVSVEPDNDKRGVANSSQSTAIKNMEYNVSGGRISVNGTLTGQPDEIFIPDPGYYRQRRYSD